MNVRTLSRHFFMLAMVALLAGGALLATTVATARPAQAAGCAAGEIGSVTSTFNVPAANADSYRLWLQLKGNTSGIVSIELDGNNCISQQISGLNTSTWLWSAIGAAQPIAAGNHTMTIKVYTSGLSMLGGMLINDGCNPNTETSLCASQVATPTPTATIVVTPKPTTTATAVVTPKPTVTPTVTPTPTAAPTATAAPAGLLTKGSWNDDKLTYSGTWNVGGNDGLYNKFQGNDHWSNVVGSSYSFKYSGTDVAIFGAKASHHGKAEITIDSRPTVTVDLYAAVRADNVLLYELKGLAAGTHTVTVKVQSGTVTVDRVDVDQTAGSTPTPTVTPTPTPTDTAAPNGPATVTPTLNFDWLNGRYRIDLGWPSATDNSGSISSYEVQRNGQKIGTSGTTGYGDLNITSGVNYSYQVFSIDGAGNRSSGSTPRAVTISCFWIFCGI